MRVTPVSGLPEVRGGDDLAGMLADAAEVGDGDVLCVASTVVSKAEGRHADLADYEPGPRAREIAARLESLSGDEKDPRFAQAVVDESEELLMDAPFLLTVTRFGHVNVNAGIDHSNVGGDADLLLLPRDPSASAARLREAMPADVAVVVTDTCGRPFRVGQRAVAIGWAGVPASRDWRGETDRDGHELRVTVESVVDELAGAANLAMGEGAGGTPAALVSDWSFGDHAGSDELFRPEETDYVRQALRGWTYEAE
ncbi:MAG TPA: coenzyme F420-0:L-glutamate ligase [Halobacteriales archaeon]|nr:coenzyme F420-0:L-glutamate ligase [Halobacteriales archaeon]